MKGTTISHGKSLVRYTNDQDDSARLETKVEENDTPTALRDDTSASTSTPFGLEAWKSGIAIGVAMDAVVLFATFVSTLVFAFAFPRANSQATLINGSCSKTRSWSIWIHLIINIVSTALLATSSYTMQCLSSPTRRDLQHAHSKGRFMSIGVPSLKNLLHINWSRSSLYCIAIISSLPIHLLANSAIFETTGTDSYLLTLVYPEFITIPIPQDPPGYSYVAHAFHSSRTFSTGNNTSAGSPKEDVIIRSPEAKLKSLIAQMERLSNAECIQAYSRKLLTGRRHVIAVMDTPLPENLNASNYNFIGNVWYQSVNVCPDCETYMNWTDTTSWTCAFLNDDNTKTVRSCDSVEAERQASDFQIESNPISYCLSEKVEEKCQLQADLRILTVVIICAFVKICTLILAMRALPHEIITTVGDAVASFLDAPDDKTRGCCLLTYKDIHRKVTSVKTLSKHKSIGSVQYHSLQNLSSSQPPPQPLLASSSSHPKQWSDSTLRKRFFSALLIRHWTTLYLIFITIFILMLTLLLRGIARIKYNTGLQGTDFAIMSDNPGTPPSSITALWRQGFGAVNVNFLLPLSDITSASPSKTIQHVLLVNTPQLLFSICYFVYNNAWTNMLVAREWAAYGTRRRGLRVSRPKEGTSQRSSYFLTIPYACAIPLQIGSALTHWLLSQSLFLARINVYSGEPFVNVPVSIINTVGYSLIALTFLIILWVILFVAVVAAGAFGRLNSPITLVGGCSLAISAACHPPDAEVAAGNAAIEEVMWGVVPITEVDSGRRIDLGFRFDFEGVETASAKEENKEQETRHCTFSAGDVVSPATLPLEAARTGVGKRSVALFA